MRAPGLILSDFRSYKFDFRVRALKALLPRKG